MSTHVDSNGAPNRAGPDWLPPSPLGLIGATSSAASVAAPLLAGFALTLAGLVLQVQTALRWPDAALTLLVAAALALLGAVQFGVWASQFAVTPDQLAQWLPDLGPRALANAQRGHLYEYHRWYQRFRAGYHLGITLLLAGLAVALVPEKRPEEWRYAAIGLAAVGGLAEMVWIWAGRYQHRAAKAEWKGRVARRILPTANAFTAPGPGSKAPEDWPAETNPSPLSGLEWRYVDARLESVAGRLDELRERVNQLESSKPISAGGD